MRETGQNEKALFLPFDFSFVIPTKNIDASLHLFLTYKDLKKTSTRTNLLSQEETSKDVI